MFFIILKIVRIDKLAVYSDSKKNMETINLSQFKNDIPAANLPIS